MVPLMLAVGIVGVGCSDPEVSGDECDSDEDCLASQTCVARSCLSVCYGVTVGDGSIGALCRSDTNCDYGECDDGSRLSTCTCQCEPFATDVGGSLASPVAWEELYTCIRDDGTCFGGENTHVTLALVQNDTRIDWTIASGVGMGSMYSGDLCETSFRWSAQPGTEPEDGCWEFSANRFNKLSYGDGFGCVGSGSKGSGSSPTPTPTCDQIASSGIDFRECPDAPAAR